MAVYFTVFNSQEESATQESERKFKSAKTLGPVNLARFIKIEAGSVAEAQEAVRNLYPGNATGMPVVVAEAAWKES
jgi:hypothetical protein